MKVNVYENICLVFITQSLVTTITIIFFSHSWFLSSCCIIEVNRNKFDFKVNLVTYGYSLWLWLFFLNNKNEKYISLHALKEFQHSFLSEI